ncbi:MAG: EpsG family protein [Clostridia bacterium]|nr:EpsG family protein [Clostridia bacterium]
MLIYIVNFLLNMAMGWFLLFFRRSTDPQAGYDQNKRKKVYLFLTTLQLGLLCGFRSTQMTYDTAAYETIFLQAPNTWRTIFKNTQYVEIGFSVLCSLIKLLGGDFQTLLILSSLFVTGSCCLFIYRHSNNVLLSVFIIISFPFYYSSFDILRHFIAISFLLLSYKYMVEKRFVWYATLLVIGSLFHTITLLFIPFYFLRYIKFNALIFLASGAVLVVVFIYMNEIASILSALMGKTDYGDSDWVGSYGGGIKTAVMYVGVFILSLLSFYQLREKKMEDHLSIFFVLFLTFCSILFIQARMLTRMIMTMIPFLAIAIPRLFDKKNTHDLQIRNFVFVLFLIIGCVYHGFMLLTSWQNVVPYIPYWK